MGVATSLPSAAAQQATLTFYQSSVCNARNWGGSGKDWPSCHSVLGQGPQRRAGNLTSP